MGRGLRASARLPSYKNPVIPAKAGISSRLHRREIPAFAGMTRKRRAGVLKRSRKRERHHRAGAVQSAKPSPDSARRRSNGAGAKAGSPRSAAKASSRAATVFSPTWSA